MGEVALLSLKMTVVPGGEPFAGITRVLTNPFLGERGRKILDELKKSVRTEFEVGGHRKPTGGVQKWDDNVIFGNRELSNPPLGGPAGAIARGWLDGTHDDVKPFKVEIGSDHPGAFVHRGGHDGTIEQTVIERTPKQTSFLRHEFGVRIPLAGTITIPARPHATTNPALEEAIARRFSEMLSREK